MDCRATGEQSDAVLRTAMPGNDEKDYRLRSSRLVQLSCSIFFTSTNPTARYAAMTPLACAGKSPDRMTVASGERYRRIGSASAFSGLARMFASTRSNFLPVLNAGVANPLAEI